MVAAHVIKGLFESPPVVRQHLSAIICLAPSGRTIAMKPQEDGRCPGPQPTIVKILHGMVVY